MHAEFTAVRDLVSVSIMSKRCVVVSYIAPPTPMAWNHEFAKLTIPKYTYRYNRGVSDAAVRARIRR